MSISRTLEAVLFAQKSMDVARIFGWGGGGLISAEVWAKIV